MRSTCRANKARLTGNCMTRSAISFATILMFSFALGQGGFAQTLSSGPSNAAEEAASLNAVRGYALRDARSLPHYTCTQTTRQTIGIANFTLTESREDTCGSERNPLFATQAVALAEGPSRADRRAAGPPGNVSSGPVSADGRDPFTEMFLPGEFGRFLGIVFDPETGADVRWDRMATLNGRRVNVFAFRVPQSRGYRLVESTRTIQVPFKGLVYADYQTAAVVRLEMKCIDIPADSEYTGADLTLDYKPARVAGQEFILPSHSRVDFQMLRGRATNDAEYRSYRRFSADSTIQFESADSTILFENDMR